MKNRHLHCIPSHEHSGLQFGSNHKAMPIATRFTMLRCCIDSLLDARHPRIVSTTCVDTAHRAASAASNGDPAAVGDIPCRAVVAAGVHRVARLCHSDRAVNVASDSSADARLVTNRLLVLAGRELL
jgi:hypothetical protein